MARVKQRKRKTKPDQWKKKPKKKEGVGYSPFVWRRIVISQMGFSTYADYLKSDLWQSIRTRVLDRDGWKCRYCGSDATQAHHRNYRTATLKGTKTQDIISVCGDCHRFISLTPAGRVATMLQMKRRTVVLINLMRTCRSSRKPAASDVQPQIGNEQR